VVPQSLKLHHLLKEERNMNVNRGWHAGKRDTLVMGLALLLALLTTVPGMAQTHSGQVTMSFQGRLLDSSGEPRSDETHCMRFRMCTDDTNCGNTQVWPSVGYEKHAVTTESGTYKAGLFSVVLGTFNPIQPSVMNNDLLYVEVGVADESSCPGATWTTMTPRSQVRTNAYAMYSRRVYTLEEADADCLVTATPARAGASTPVLRARPMVSRPAHSTPVEPTERPTASSSTTTARRPTRQLVASRRRAKPA
jgi:hypothetical protein